MIRFSLFHAVEPSGGNKNCPKKITKNHNSKSKPHELDGQGLVPLPAKTCFYCRKSCKKAPLIACDYCPLYFHQDCLDPPMTALPTGLWMCPNHPEQFIVSREHSLRSFCCVYSTISVTPKQDWKLVSSVSATERIKLWNRFAGPVDQESVKAEFFRKVHNKNPPFRFKVKTLPREAIQIPPMIEYHYKNPPSLLPSLRDVLRCEAVHKKGTAHELLHIDLKNMVHGQLRELRDANKKIINFNSSDDVDNTDFSCDPPTQDSDQTDTDCNAKTDDDENAKDAEQQTIEPLSVQMNATNLAKASEEMEKFDLSLIKLLALQRLQQIMAEHPDVVAQYQEETANRTIHAALVRQPNAMAMPSQLLTKDDIERIARKFAAAGSNESSQAAECRSPSPTADAATESKRIKIDQLYCSNGFDELKTDEDKANAIALRLETPLMQMKIKARAVLTPVGDILNGDR